MTDPSENNKTADLFDFSASAPAPEAPAVTPAPEEPVPAEPVAPEAPAAGEPAAPVEAENADLQQKEPLIFSEHSPIPTRGGKELEPPNAHHHSGADIHPAFAPLMLSQVPDGATMGEILKLAREKASYSFDEVKSITRIAHQYLTAMENDVIKDLPPHVFSSAYLRTLAKLYRLPADLTEKLQKELLSHFSGREDLSAELFEKVSSDTLVIEAEERRVKYLSTAFAITIGVFILLGIWAIVAAIVHHAGDHAAEQQTVQIHTEAEKPQTVPVQFDQTELESLNPPPITDINVLEMGKTPSVLRR